MADVTDSKSVGSDTVWVRVPPSAPRRSKVRFAPTSFFCLRQKRRHPHAPLLLLSNCDPLCWLAVGRPPCGRHSSPIGGLGGSPSLPGLRGHPHAPLLLLSNCDPLCWLAVGRPPCGRHSFPIGGLRGSPVPSRPGTVRFAPTSFSACGKKDAIRTLPCSSFPTATRFAGSQLAGRPAGGILLQSEVSGGPRSFQAGGAVRFAPAFFSACGKKDAIRTLPCSSFPTATRFAGSQLAGRPAGGILLQSEVSGVPVPSRLGAVRFAPIFFVPGKKRHPHARRQSSAAVSVYHIPFALSRQGRRCAHFHSP